MQTLGSKLFPAEDFSRMENPQERDPRLPVSELHNLSSVSSPEEERVFQILIGIQVVVDGLSGRGELIGILAPSGRS